jgi:hypothetical protein
MKQALLLLALLEQEWVKQVSYGSMVVKTNQGLDDGAYQMRYRCDESD